jgi:RimJ/RimL family protein N-acetyltransferase
MRNETHARPGAAPCLRLPRLSDGTVALRAFTDADAPLIQSVGSDPLIPLITTVPASGSTAEALGYIARQHDRLRTGAGYSFAVTDAATDEAFGQIGLWLHDLRQGRASIGYWIAPARRRRGGGSRALAVLVRWAWTVPGLERLELYVEPWNEASWRTAEAAGFQREGVLRQWQAVGQTRRDMFMYSLLRSDTGQADTGQADPG